MSWIQIKRWFRDMTSTQRHYCKRRLENCIKGCRVHTYCDQGVEEPDIWYKRDGVLTCSYCGGIKPSEVMRLINGDMATDLESTDKYYKFYLHTPQKTFKVYMQHDTEDSFNEMIQAAKGKNILNAWKKRLNLKPV